MKFNKSAILYISTRTDFSLPQRQSWTIPTEVTDFLKFMKSRTGASFIVFGVYTNEDGEQSFGQYAQCVLFGIRHLIPS